MRALLITTALSLMALPGFAFAQEPPQLPPVDHNQLVSSNLFGVVAKWANIEYERKTGSSLSAGLSASSFFIREGEDGRMNRANAFVRFYPQGAALSGIFIGMRAGIVRNRPYGGGDSAVAAGIEVGRTRLFGARKNVALSAGFRLDRAWYDGESVVIPNIRLFNVGIAF